MIAGWKLHCIATGADPDHISEEDISVFELTPGQCLRDGVLLS